MTDSARSSSDAPVCASLERAASAKSSPLLLAWVADNRQCSQELHRRVGSILPAFFQAATAGYVWRAKPVPTRAPGAPARRSGFGQPLCGGDSLTDGLTQAVLPCFFFFE